MKVPIDILDGCLQPNSVREQASRCVTEAFRTTTGSSDNFRSVLEVSCENRTDCALKDVVVCSVYRRTVRLSEQVHWLADLRNLLSTSPLTRSRNRIFQV